MERMEETKEENGGDHDEKNRKITKCQNFQTQMKHSSSNCF